MADAEAFGELPCPAVVRPAPGENTRNSRAGTSVHAPGPDPAKV